MDDKANVVIVGLLCVTVLICVALYMGIDGVLLTTGIGAITGIIGIFFGIRLEAKKATTGEQEV